MERFMRSSRHFKIISQILILAMLHLCWLTSYGYAEMVPTESAIEQPSTSNTDRQRLLDLLSRQEAVDELEKYGISKVEAVARINSLTDEEVTEISGKLDEFEAGGEVGALIFYFGLLLAPLILTGVFYVAFLPFAAGVCVFVEDPWSDCMGDYWGFYTNLWGIKKAPNECTKKCDIERTKCIDSKGYSEEFLIGTKEYYEEFLEKGRQCNLDKADCLKNCQIEEDKERLEKEASEKVEEESDSVPVEEDCDPGMESCT
jgi:uncharacterized protein DUF6627